MKAILIMSFCFLTLSCATQKDRPESIRGITEISFGKGGGFTGMTEEYLITGNAEVFKIVNSERTKINQVTKPVVREISKQIKDLQFKDIKLSEKGNMTYFIKVSANKYSNIVTWSDLTDTPEIKELYKTLVKTLTPE
jgi:hypothetical protein